MKSRFLFRGKRLDNKEWVVGHYTQDGVGRHRITRILKEYPWIAYNEVDPNTIGQYTGLKNKNSELIFEGDILRWKFTSFGDNVELSKKLCEGVGEVFFNNSKARFSVRGKQEERENMLTEFNTRNDVEIIGNIHDNPELLEV